MKLHEGQRINIFGVSHAAYGDDVFKPGCWYAETVTNPYRDNPYGSDMIGDEPIPDTLDKQYTGWHLNIPSNMKQVGTLIIKKIK
jgi:hypothetical protein